MPPRRKNTNPTEVVDDPVDDINVDDNLEENIDDDNNDIADPTSDDEEAIDPIPKHDIQVNDEEEAEEAAAEPYVASATPAVETSFASALAQLLDRSSTRGTDVRHPDKFNGIQRSKYRTFIAQCSLVFRANPHKFKKDSTKVRLIFSVSYFVF